MKQPKNLVAALVLTLLLTAGGIANAEGLGGRFYIEAGVLTADPDEAVATFTDDNLDATWSLATMRGAKAQIGGDFGYVRTDVKVRAMRGGVDSISGTPGGSGANITSDDAIIAIGTVNVFGEFDIDVTDNFTITPYIGIGTGYAHGFLQANAPGDANVSRTEHRNDGGRATVGMVGALFEVMDTVGLTAEYERIDTGLEGHNDIDSFSLGLRLTF